VDHRKGRNIVGHHLRALRAAGLPRSRRAHKVVFYSLSESGRRLIDTHLELAEAAQ